MQSILGLLPTLGPMELVLILALALVVFGAGKLPGVGKAIGQSLREFRAASKEDEHEQGTTPKNNS
ncbi:twin-arginine translocase TatA/TatE family subunit [Candidatus Formimonas warabiya]|uniref:Sec-independent protein translocase protein TatA n=1 Tax=Formimonas warabiya TaxID=1761012 RepID=A0A3G1L2G7_FORW1|nr:twin-arginine translocase TatA/TatE family subunit [Candidatus Formimonas warabiya]ATW28844.1 hypothetical protein DCMF_23280 [Candidatus Formimonas warabiya]